MRFDVVVFGATGFTGRLVVEYLAQKARKRDGQPLRVAVCGRDAKRVEDVIASSPGGASGARRAAPTKTHLEAQVLSLDDANALRGLTADAGVVISCAGPFARVGMPVVDACTSTRTPYVDITGESVFVRRVIERHQDDAAAKHTVLVPSCGFDSVPSDLGAYFVATLAQRRFHGEKVRSVLGVALTSLSGGASTGTLSSICNMLDEMSADRGAFSPYALNPRDDADAARSPLCSAAADAFERDALGVTHVHEEQLWTYPFVMAAYNTRVVRRSAALSRQIDRQRVGGGGGGGPRPYGDNFSYREVSATRSMLSAFTSWLMTVVPLMLLFVAPLRRRFERSLKRSAGPPPSAGGFKLGFAAHTEGGRVVRATVSFGDPYRETATSVSECALALLEDADRLPGGRTAGGVLTPATAFGDVLIERLQAAGWSFREESGPLGGLL